MAGTSGVMCSFCTQEGHSLLRCPSLQTECQWCNQQGHTAQLCPYMGILCPRPKCRKLMYPIIARSVDHPLLEDFLLKCPNEECPRKLWIYENKVIGGEENQVAGYIYREIDAQTFNDFVAENK